MERKRSLSLASLDLNLLYTFRVFVEQGSLLATARALGRSQPAISARLHQLERELEVRLLHRVGRRLHLTPTGRAVDRELTALFGGLRAIVDQARIGEGEPAGVLQVGALTTAGVHLLVPKIAELAVRHPGVRVELAYGHVRELLEALRRGELDVVVGVGDPPARELAKTVAKSDRAPQSSRVQPQGGATSRANARRGAPTPRTGPDRPRGDGRFGDSLAVQVLGHARAALVLRRGAAGFPRGKVRAARLAELAWVAYGRTDDPFFDAVWSFMARHGLDERARVTVPHIQTLKGLVAAGAGVAILPDYTVNEPELETRAVHGLDVSQPIWAATREASLPIPLVAAFHALLRPGREVDL